MLHDQETYINIKKILLINLLTLYALCLQDNGQKEQLYYNRDL